MTNIKEGDCVLFKSLAQIVKEHEVNEHNEFVCKNVDVHVKYLGDIMHNSYNGEVCLTVYAVDDDGDFSVSIYEWGIFFGNEMIREVVKSRPDHEK